MFKYYNPNPRRDSAIDCTVRAIGLLLDQDWDTTYVALCAEGFLYKSMPNDNDVWKLYLEKNGYYREPLPSSCPNCYTIRQFVREHPNGKYLLHTGGHVVTAINGNYYDTWDSGDEVPIYYWRKGD